jgi:hypothetical protein
VKQNQIDLVRRFNRAITQRIGALDDAYLSRGRSLGLSRLLWEIGPAGCEVRLLRARLGLDSGYFSRQLRRLEAWRKLAATEKNDWSSTMCRRIFAATDDCTALSATRGIAACAAKFK